MIPDAGVLTARLIAAIAAAVAAAGREPGVWVVALEGSVDFEAEVDAVVEDTHLWSAGKR